MARLTGLTGRDNVTLARSTSLLSRWRILDFTRDQQPTTDRLLGDDAHLDRNPFSRLRALKSRSLRTFTAQARQR
jgi:hypothetical protein